MANHINILIVVRSVEQVGATTSILKCVKVSLTVGTVSKSCNKYIIQVSS